jgi:hypothetical protein
MFSGDSEEYTGSIFRVQELVLVCYLNTTFPTLGLFFTLKTEALRLSKPAVNIYQTTRRHIKEDSSCRKFVKQNTLVACQYKGMSTATKIILWRHLSRGYSTEIVNKKEALAGRLYAVTDVHNTS